LSLRVFTIGFTRKSAEQFFELVRSAGARSLTDVRRRPDTQLSGFAQARDLRYFLPKLAGIPYRHELLLAPSTELLNDYRRHGLAWDDYVPRYLAELRERHVETALNPADLDETILLCSEPATERCHRRLCLEYLAEYWGPIARIDL
jgi:uncharacterized protein (DUF488 family)